MNTSQAKIMKEKLRAELNESHSALWPDTQANRPPLFDGRGKAAEKLRRLPEYKRARVIVVMPDPVLLQVRINALNDGKTLIAATPGLKQGLVRLNAGDIPVPHRPRLLTGYALFQAGHPMRFPEAKLNKIDMLVGAAMAADSSGHLLGDGRGLLDLLAALLTHMGAMTNSSPLVALIAEEQIIDEIPIEPWDVSADKILTPERDQNFKSQRPRPDFSRLPERLAHLPLVKAVLGPQDF